MMSIVQASVIPATVMKEPVMPLIRPLDPAFPIERQLTLEASPVVLVNVFTMDEADEETFLQGLARRCVRHDAAAGPHLDPASPRDRREPDLSQLRRLGIERPFPGCIHASGVQGKTVGLSVLGRCFSTPVPEGGGTRHLRGVDVTPARTRRHQVPPPVSVMTALPFG